MVAPNELDDADLAAFNGFVGDMIDVTSDKIKGLEPGRVDWFTAAKHLLNPYQADTPCLRLARAMRGAPASLPDCLPACLPA